MYCVGECLIKPGPYREAYLRRKDYERARAEAAGLTVLPAAKITKAKAATCMSAGHVHRRAQRYMEKMLLRALLAAWKRAEAATAALEAPEDRTRSGRETRGRPDGTHLTGTKSYSQPT